MVRLVLLIALDQLLLLCWVVVLFEVRFEVLKKCYLLLQLLGVVGKTVLGHYILFLVS